jgi:hypothetical protein
MAALFASVSPYHGMAPQQNHVVFTWIRRASATRFNPSLLDFFPNFPGKPPPTMDKITLIAKLRYNGRLRTGLEKNPALP